MPTVLSPTPLVVNRENHTVIRLYTVERLATVPPALPVYTLATLPLVGPEGGLIAVSDGVISKLYVFLDDAWGPVV